MNIVYTKHAEIRIKQRAIDKHLIERTVSRPDKIMPSFKGRSCAQKSLKGRTLEVVYKRLNGEILIITAYWIKEVE